MPSFIQKPKPQAISNIISDVPIGPQFGPKFVKQSIQGSISLGMNSPQHANGTLLGKEENMPRIVNYMADQGGCGLWRIIWPCEHLLSYKKATTMNMYQMVVEPYFYATVDAVKFQRQCKDNQVDLIKHIKKISDAKEQKYGKKVKLIWEVDDIVAPADCITDFNRNKEAFETEKILNNLKKITEVVDEFLVVSRYMRDHYRKYLDYEKVSVVPNYLPSNWLNNRYNHKDKMENWDKNKKKPRVGYIGSATHFDVKNKTGQIDDFAHVNEFIHKTKDKYQWVFVGGYPLVFSNLVKRGEIEYHPWKPIMELPDFVLSLNLQASIAPLYAHPFNRAKSDIKLMESAALGTPCVCQNLEPYEEAIFKFDKGDEMISQLEYILCDKNYEKCVIDSRKLVEDRWLHQHLDEHLLIYTTEYSAKEREQNSWFMKNNK